MVGVLALQGNFDSHRLRLEALGARVRLIRKVEDLAELQGVVLPGGESTALLRLLDPVLREELTRRILSGLPTLGTCAGVILLAKQVQNPVQESLGLLDVTVSRNAYGRQVDSFIDSELRLTLEGRNFMRQCCTEDTVGTSMQEESLLEGVFIRAPRITAVGAEVEVLIARAQEPVLVREKNVLAATFHPELSERAKLVHALFLANVRRCS
ncbi:MAG: pyridoxal 5'-phosphate synthase glutaminase subunit PdxT [Bdellovibrionales bacterium]|nr:pyridoxal 5'-phosphate synthase glutaminase subunit PdxT [Bdellovibrionales bacterium]